MGLEGSVFLIFVLNINCVPTVYVLSKSKKTILIFSQKIFFFPLLVLVRFCNDTINDKYVFISEMGIYKGKVKRGDDCQVM